jgi:hypothetical protein
MVKPATAPDRRQKRRLVRKAAGTNVDAPAHHR